MRKSGVAGKYVRVVQDMSESCGTMEKCTVGEFKAGVGQQQGPSLSILVAVVIATKGLSLSYDVCMMLIL